MFFEEAKNTNRSMQMKFWYQDKMFGFCKKGSLKSFDPVKIGKRGGVCRKKSDGSTVTSRSRDPG